MTQRSRIKNARQLGTLELSTEKPPTTEASELTQREEKSVVSAFKGPPLSNKCRETRHQ